MLILRELYFQEKDLDAESNLSKYKVELLDEDEFSHYESSTEYSTFIQSYYNLYVYEAMRLGLEFKGFNTIDHVIMIHHLATFIGKQMTSKHVEIDLGKVSAASMGHDIGKFGCIGDEVSRVPYLHYYYTDKWFKDNAMPMIGHIATNHSVWDIELENLPIESLVLIYSDFRVKNDAKGKMNIFSLDEFGFKEDKYESTETRVAWIDVPANSTVESVTEKLKSFPKARINKYLSNSPILSDTDKYAIDNPDLEVDLDTFANRQVVRYGANHENAGELILDRNGKVQYRRNAFSPSGAADVDIRSAEAEMYLSEEIRAEFNGIAMESQSI